MPELKSVKELRLSSKSCRRFKDAPNSEDLYLTIADGDFAFAKNIGAAVQKVVATGCLAYEYQESKNYHAVQAWYKKHYQYEFQENQILFGNGVLYWMQIAINALTNKGDGVLIQKPVYDSFADIVTDASRKVVNSPLVYKDHKFKIDFVDLAIKMQSAKLMLICSPHNPTGSVWSKPDLIKIVELAKENDVTLVFDEIWQDFVFGQKNFLSLHLSNIWHKIILVSSPAKTFSLGGLQYGFTIIEDPTLLEKMRHFSHSIIHYSSSQPWTSAAVEAAYTEKESEEWLELYLRKIEQNLSLINKYFDSTKLDYARAESSYLVWIKLGNDNLQGEDLEKKLTKVGLHLTVGHLYGPEWAQWVRINIAISTSDVQLLIEKLKIFLSA